MHPPELQQNIDKSIPKRHKQGMKTLLFLCLFAFLPLQGQTPVPELVSLRALNDSMMAQEKELNVLQAKFRANSDEHERSQIQTEINRLSKQLGDLRVQFQGIALSTDTSVYDAPVTSEFNLQREIEQLVQPLLSELKAATSDSREMETLRQNLALQQSRIETASQALANLDKLLATDPAPELASRLQELRTLWQGRLRDATNQRTVLGQQIELRETAKQSLLDRTRGAASTFVRTRGRNLFLGIFTFVLVFLSMKALHGRFSRLRFFKGRSFTPRLFNLMWTFASILGALIALMAVFNLVGDWFLLSLVIVFLLGVGWAGIKTLPQFLEQIRMMLNIGSIREGERLVFNDIPWKVDSIGFATRLVNPLLDGGILLVPTRLLLGLTSRQPGHVEEWFPSRVQDWVVLADGSLGRVATQNPANVQIVHPGGAQRVIPTPAYMAMSPLVLTPGFRCEFLFGVDYRHQDVATTVIPERMTKHLRETLSTRLGDALKQVRVEFAEADNSSLNFAITLDCSGDAAAEYTRIPRWAQAALVDLCTRENWLIPFPQLQIHSQPTAPAPA
jgi:hypothetical protein